MTPSSIDSSTRTSSTRSSATIRARTRISPGQPKASGSPTSRHWHAGVWQAWGFMTSLAIVAQAMDHHPAFENVYTKVVVELWTHDLGGLSNWDFKLASEAERLLPPG